MAEGSIARSWQSQVQCRYFLHSVCRNGDSCPYSHDLTARPSNICKFYLKGCCTYGNSCRYDHTKPRAPPPPTAAQTPAAPKTSPASKPHVIQCDDLEVSSKMVKLAKFGKTESNDDNPGTSEFELISSPQSEYLDKWVAAAEFVPGQPWKGSGPASYLDAAQTGIEDTTDAAKILSVEELEEHGKTLCPFAANGECRYDSNCTYLHGDVCEWCGKAVLHPTDTSQRDKHKEECLKQHEEDMELSFAVARSKDKTCGICMDTVLTKQPLSERRFGILSNCSHVFCLSCIRKWRSATQFENKTIRACPECRVKSDFVTPSKYWVEEKEDKEKLIEGYKTNLNKKPCKYFDEGRGECPFNENCFYLHAYPDGRIASPKPQRRRERRNGDGDLDIVRELLLWDFLEEHRRRVTLHIEFDDEMDELLFQAGYWELSSPDSSDVEFP